MPEVIAPVPTEVHPPTRNRRKKNALLTAFAPNGFLLSREMVFMTWAQVVAMMLFWIFSPSAVFPGPMDLFDSLRELALNRGLGPELIKSLSLMAEALAIATVGSLLLAYSTAMPFFRPIVRFIGTNRFLGLTGVSLIFMLRSANAHWLKINLLVFLIGVYYLTALVRIVQAIPEAEKDYFRTLGMSEWQVVYATVIRGRAAEMFEALRQNSAMGWMMLTTVEGLVKSEGGIGALMLESYRFRRLDEVFAMQVLLWCLGLGQDYLFSWLRPKFFPWADKRLKGGK